MIRRTLTTIASAGVIAATTAGPALACNQPTPTTSGSDSQPQQTQQARYAYDGHFRHHHHHGYLHWLNQQQGSDQQQQQQSSDNQQPQTAGSQGHHHCHPGDNSQGSSSQS